MGFCLYNLFINNFHCMYEITPLQKQFIQVFIDKCPQVFQTITDSVSKISKDGNINIYDIPEIIKCITEIYHSHFIEQELQNTEHLLFFIKCTIYILIESEFIMIPNIEEVIIEKMIDCSIDLLAYKLIPKKIETLSKCYCCIV